MMSRISNFFTDSGQVLLNPDDFLFLKSQEKDYNGIISLLFYTGILALLIGITTLDPIMTVVLVLVFIIGSLIINLVRSVIAFIFAKLLGGNGGLISTFNLISYSSVLNILLYIGFVLTFFDKLAIIPIILLVFLWKMVIEITAVSEEHNIGYAKAFLSTYGIYLIILVIIMGLI